jgi:hypothetical protein
MAAPRNRLGKVARVVILVGLALPALGNAVEAIVIWGFRRQHRRRPCGIAPPSCRATCDQSAQCRK